MNEGYLVPTIRTKRKRQSKADSVATMICYATGPGGRTLDNGEDGGNPFASALIEAAGKKELRLMNLMAHLRRLTMAKSHGHQVIECFGEPGLPDWSFQDDNHAQKEKRSALVLVVSDYSGTGLYNSLHGAARDERRIAAMLAQYGFSVDQGIGPRRRELIRAMISFGHRSRRSDIAIIYSTGHGVECDGTVYLIPGDYPVFEGFGRDCLRRRAVAVHRIADAASAGSQNIVFFAGCRTNASDMQRVFLSG